MLDLTTVIIFVLVLLLGYWLLKKPQNKNSAPGPGLKFFFKFFALQSKPHLLIKNMMKEYGSVVRIQFGSEPAFFIFDYDLIKQLFLQNADYSSNRPDTLWLMNQLSKGKGIIFNPDTWKATRKFALHSMRDFGLGKQSIEERIQDEARALVEVFRGKSNQAFDPLEDITKTVSNIICSMCFGRRYSYSDAEFVDVLHKMDAYFKSDFNSSILNSTPWLRHFSFLSKRFSLEYFTKNIDAIREFVLQEIEKHKETYDPDNMRDLVDLYIQAEKNNFENMKEMDAEQLLQTIVDLFNAGTETTTNTLRWILLYLINNTEVQKKCQQEINEVIGKDNLPNYRERNKFPYVMATIQEAIRLKTVALGSLPHKADKDLELGGYIIPKGSTVISINMGIMFDPKIWGDDPEEFRPERWLNETGELRSIPEFLPFGLGRRACPGEQLAKTELLIDLVALLQNFTFQAEDPENPPPVEGVAKLTYVPNPFKIVAKSS